MKRAGYKLEFQRASAAESAQALCDRLSAGTGWREKTDVIANAVCVKRDTPLGTDDFDEESFEDGETLFQRLCLAVAGQHADAAFEGVCHFEDADAGVKLRITVSHVPELLRFRIRRTTPERIQLWRLDWDRRANGALEKSEYASYREKGR